jgi:hypothetical protein
MCMAMPLTPQTSHQRQLIAPSALGGHVPDVTPPVNSPSKLVHGSMGFSATATVYVEHPAWLRSAHKQHDCQSTVCVDHAPVLAKVRLELGLVGRHVPHHRVAHQAVVPLGAVQRVADGPKLQRHTTSFLPVQRPPSMAKYIARQQLIRQVHVPSACLTCMRLSCVTLLLWSAAPGSCRRRPSPTCPDAGGSAAPPGAGCRSRPVALDASWPVDGNARLRNCITLSAREHTTQWRGDNARQ